MLALVPLLRNTVAFAFGEPLLQPILPDTHMHRHVPIFRLDVLDPKIRRLQDVTIHIYNE